MIQGDAEHGFVLNLGKISAEDAAKVGEIVAVFDGAQRRDRSGGSGGFVAALVALAEMRRRRSTLAGHVSMELHERGGDPAQSSAAWRVLLNVAPIRWTSDDLSPVAQLKGTTEPG